MCRVARGEAPSRRAELERVAEDRSTTYCLMASLVKTERTALTIAVIVAASVTGLRVSSGETWPWLSSMATSARDEG